VPICLNCGPFVWISHPGPIDVRENNVTKLPADNADFHGWNFKLGKRDSYESIGVLFQQNLLSRINRMTDVTCFFLPSVAVLVEQRGVSGMSKSIRFYVADDPRIGDLQFSA
jgi:hypothetical protein